MRWTILWLLTTLAATCGQKGPLYLPDGGDSPQQDAQVTRFHASATRR